MRARPGKGRFSGPLAKLASISEKDLEANANAQRPGARRKQRFNPTVPTFRIDPEPHLYPSIRQTSESNSYGYEKNREGNAGGPKEGQNIFPHRGFFF